MTRSPLPPTGQPAPPPTRRRRAARTIAAAALLTLLAAPLGGCSNSPPDTCLDVSGWICDRLTECGRLVIPFGTPERCLDSFDGLFRVQQRTDDACTGEWALVEDLPCGPFVAYFEI